MSGPIGAETIGTLVPPAIIAALAVWRAHRLAGRLRSLTTPVHELRGALSALELGLESARRRAVWSRVLEGRLEGIRVQLDRAGFALADLERARLGERGCNEQEHPETFDLAQLVLRKVRGWSELAPAYGARVDVDWRAGKVSAKGDSGRLGQALDNLISNALEHGGDRVLVRGERRARRVRITIADRGPGLAQPVAPLPETSWRSPRGHGLAIARQAVDSHRGSLTAETGEGGTVMVLELPIEHVGARSGPSTAQSNGPVPRGDGRPAAATARPSDGRANAEIRAA